MIYVPSGWLKIPRQLAFPSKVTISGNKFSDTASYIFLANV